MGTSDEEHRFQVETIPGVSVCHLDDTSALSMVGLHLLAAVLAESCTYVLSTSLVSGSLFATACSVVDDHTWKQFGLQFLGAGSIAW